MQVSVGYFSESHPYFCLVCGPVRIKEQSPQKHMFERDWTTKWSFIYHSTLNSESQVGGPMLLVKVGNQQTCNGQN